MVTHRYPDGWWVGQLSDGRSGAFPSNYVRALNEDSGELAPDIVDSPIILDGTLSF